MTDARKLKERNRKKAARKAAERQAFLKKYGGATGQDYLNLLSSVFDEQKFNVLALTNEQRVAARKVLGYRDRYYCWVSGDEIRTNRYARVPLKEARVALKLWASGKDMRTLRVGNYSIISYTGDTIQIGCHKLERRNMLALYEAVIGKPFPTKERSEETCQ